ncbi:MAG: hypothetical protein K2M48_02775 [Clostridiales bacterium]|nr:hypothetical protein [Clostridiales bacterium]
MIIGRLLNKIINIFTGLFAISTLILMLVWYINSAVGGFLTPSSALTLERVRNYFMLATVFCAGSEFTLKRNLILAVVFACIVAAVAAFMIYSDITMI